jgi:hypothetical protein
MLSVVPRRKISATVIRVIPGIPACPVRPQERDIRPMPATVGRIVTLAKCAG